jgi:hypothetical protein
MARVEVNGRKGILITVRTGSGQGDPLSSILFLIGSEPLNTLMVAKFAEIMYTTLEGIKVGPILFADDNLSPTKLQRIEQLDPVLAIYDRYTWVLWPLHQSQEILSLMHQFVSGPSTRLPTQRVGHTRQHETPFFIMYFSQLRGPPHPVQAIQPAGWGFEYMLQTA